jgi:Na+/melibiose symporter-like transporter
MDLFTTGKAVFTLASLLPFSSLVFFVNRFSELSDESRLLYFICFVALFFVYFVYPDFVKKIAKSLALAFVCVLLSWVISEFGHDWVHAAVNTASDVRLFIERLWIEIKQQQQGAAAAAGK